MEISKPRDTQEVSKLKMENMLYFAVRLSARYKMSNLHCLANRLVKAGSSLKSAADREWSDSDPLEPN